jgi:hypothetical protein
MRLCGVFIFVCFIALRLLAHDTKFQPAGEQIRRPEVAVINEDNCCHLTDEVREPGAAFQTWIEDVRHWRAERRIRIGHDGSQYERPELTWTQSSFIQPQMIIEDRYFYDPLAGKYTVDWYLDDLEKRYGGIDSVLIWHTCPNIGIDNRNQYDLLRDMPGGIEGVRQMIADFHWRGVRVLFPVMLWDQGTRNPEMSNTEATGLRDGAHERRHLATLGRPAEPVVQFGVGGGRVTSMRQHVGASPDTGALPAAIRENVRPNLEGLRQHSTTFFLKNRSKIAISKGNTDEGGCPTDMGNTCIIMYQGVL